MSHYLAGIADDLIPLERDVLRALHDAPNGDLADEDLVVDLEARPSAVAGALTTLRTRRLADRRGARPGRHTATPLGALVAAQLAQRKAAAR